MTNQVFYFLFLVLLASGCSQLNAQGSRSDDSLYSVIAHLDSALFNAFNSRDTARFKTFFTDDLEFYHDKGGLSGYEQTVGFMRSTANSKTDLRRDLVAGSLEVYAVPNYGAMEIGAHIFCHTENGKLDCGTFKFVHIWKKTGNEWKITRVVSYGH